jgi:hypothetical protein
VGLCIAVLQDDLFFPGHCHAVHDKPLKCVKVMSSIDGFTLWQKLNQYASFIPKDSLRGLMG